MLLECRFDFATSNANAGEVVSMGTADAYEAAYDTKTYEGAYETDSQTVLEVCGVEIDGPFSAGRRVPIKSLKLKVGGDTLSDVIFNEKMAPYNKAGAQDLGPADFWAGDKYRNFCTNLGIPITMPHLNGPNWSPTIKVGPLSSIDVEVQFPRTSEGGDATISTAMNVRLSMVKVRTQGTLERLLTAKGALSGGQVDQSWTIADLESGRSQVVDKKVPFSIEQWDTLNGGEHASYPTLVRDIKWTQNSAATTANQYYTFEQTNNHVTESFQEFDWEMATNEALQIHQFSLLADPNDRVQYLQFYKEGQIEHPTYMVDSARNAFPFPRAKWTADNMGTAPRTLPKPFTVWGENASILVKDDGTSIPAWASGVEGVQMAYWGYSYVLPKGV